MKTWYRTYQSLMETIDVTPEMKKEIVKFAYDHIDWSGGEGETIEDMYKRENLDYDDLYDENGNEKDIDVEHNTDFMSWFSDHVEEKYWNAEYEIKKRIKGDVIKLYRCITAPDDWKPNPVERHIGIYWTWDEKTAIPHWGGLAKGHVEWIIVGEVHTKDIDWIATLGMNGAGNYDEEQEVRLKENAPVKILNYYKKTD